MIRFSFARSRFPSSLTLDLTSAETKGDAVGRSSQAHPPASTRSLVAPRAAVLLTPRSRLPWLVHLSTILSLPNPARLAQTPLQRRCRTRRTPPVGSELVKAPIVLLVPQAKSQPTRPRPSSQRTIPRKGTRSYQARLPYRLRLLPFTQLVSPGRVASCASSPVRALGLLLSLSLHRSSPSRTRSATPIALGSPMRL
jgi:hypothetical protein